MTTSLPAYTLIPLPGEGPGDVVVGPDGVIYTGLRDGRVLGVAPEDGAVAELPGFPDNLCADDDGIVWAALASEPNPALESLHKLPLFLRRLAARLPESVLPKPSRVAWIAAYDERGACVHNFKWTDGGYAMVTGLCRVGRRIWCAGLQERALMRFDLPG